MKRTGKIAAVAIMTLLLEVVAIEGYEDLRPGGVRSCKLTWMGAG
jgi:hypothetical protein